ncbi:MAG: PTS mannitol transporter subunit IICBA [Clostridium perfringens]|nr:PTS mannitol transporter subunit IICBA [Clostridium perfringens]
MMIREKVQKGGKFLSSMIIPNIGIFMAWGIMATLFMPFGWMPNEGLAKIVNNMSIVILPIMIGGAGGRLTGGIKGGIIAIVATMGVIASSNIPMILGAMIIGPLSGLIIKKFYSIISNKIPVGFEMLVDNFSIGIIAVIMLIFGYYIIGPFVVILTQVAIMGMNKIIAIGVLPLAAIVIEPAKVLFLNNAINHGILGPFGIEQVQQSGKSIMFLLEANPGPGFGMLLAYYLFSKDKGKKLALGAAIINFFGGIHEIYFPYIIKKPILIISTILGGMAGIFTASILDAGLVSSASPGSIFTLIALSPKGEILGTIICVASATVVSFIISTILLKMTYKDREINENEIINKEIYDEVELDKLVNKEIKKIVFVCDAGIGSSAMAAANFRKRIKELNLDIVVTNASVDNVILDADLVISHIKLEKRCKRSYLEVNHIFINNFFEDDKLDKLYKILENKSIKDNEENKSANEEKFSVLTSENIILGLDSESKEEAITRAGRLLVDRGYVTEEYISSMYEREKVYSTYIGMGIAIPHGMNEAKEKVKKSGVVILQYPKGINFGEGIVYLVIGIAGSEEGHLKIMSSIAEFLGNGDLTNRLDKINNKEELLCLFK